jgi:D-serine deaminase-like pyridoxal phosphate-dependent protein
MRLDELDTPVPVVDLDKVERNLRRMQDYCDAHGLKLRPHIKTHKLPQFARRQVELGAVGITCQKIGEAEVMADAGLDDILISYPIVGAPKIARLAALARRVRLTCAVDNAVALDTVAAAAAQGQAGIGVLVEFDSGNGRTGVVSVEQALDLARIAAAKPFIKFRGLMTYPSSARSAEFVTAAKPVFAAAGLPIEMVSGGGTPEAWSAHTVAGVGEYRVGTYVYHDRATVGAGVAELDDCALLVHATVVSRPTDDRAIIDAGSKTLSSDKVDPALGAGHGVVLGYPDAVIVRLNEEHGIIDLSRSARKPGIGERLRIVPNHVCVVTNLHDEVVVARGDEVEGIWPVPARGKTR